MKYLFVLIIVLLGIAACQDTKHKPDQGQLIDVQSLTCPDELIGAWQSISNPKVIIVFAEKGAIAVSDIRARAYVHYWTVSKEMIYYSLFLDEESVDMSGRPVDSWSKSNYLITDDILRLDDPIFDRRSKKFKRIN